ncbi:MAG: hypothetical protein ACXWWN_02455 [Gemmatimonadales bacterium]
MTFDAAVAIREYVPALPVVERRISKASSDPDMSLQERRIWLKLSALARRCLGAGSWELTDWLGPAMVGADASVPRSVQPSATIVAIPTRAMRWKRFIEHQGV